MLNALALALTVARQEAADANTTEHGCSLNDLADMALLAVFPGHHTPALTAYDEPSPPTAGEHPPGTEIYYTGDVANQSGFGIITALNRDPQWGDTYDFTLEDGRVIKGIATHSLGDKYEGHGGTRFVTKAAYDEYRQKVTERYAGQEQGRGCRHDRHLLELRGGMAARSSA